MQTPSRGIQPNINVSPLLASAPPPALTSTPAPWEFRSAVSLANIYFFISFLSLTLRQYLGDSAQLFPFLAFIYLFQVISVFSLSLVSLQYLGNSAQVLSFLSYISLFQAVSVFFLYFLSLSSHQYPGSSQVFPFLSFYFFIFFIKSYLCFFLFILSLALLQDLGNSAQLFPFPSFISFISCFYFLALLFLSSSPVPREFCSAISVPIIYFLYFLPVLTSSTVPREFRSAVSLPIIYFLISFLSLTLLQCLGKFCTGSYYLFFYFFHVLNFTSVPRETLHRVLSFISLSHFKAFIFFISSCFCVLPFFPCP